MSINSYHFLDMPNEIILHISTFLYSETNANFQPDLETHKKMRDLVKFTYLCKQNQAYLTDVWDNLYKRRFRAQTIPLNTNTLRSYIFSANISQTIAIISNPQQKDGPVRSKVYSIQSCIVSLDTTIKSLYQEKIELLPKDFNLHISYQFSNETIKDEFGKKRVIFFMADPEDSILTNIYNLQKLCANLLKESYAQKKREKKMVKGHSEKFIHKKSLEIAYNVITFNIPYSFIASNSDDQPIKRSKYQ